MPEPNKFNSAVWEFADLVQCGAWKQAFVTGRQILDHCSYRRMPAWIDALAKIMVKMGRGDELPEEFSQLTLLARKDILDRVEIKFR